MGSGGCGYRGLNVFNLYVDGASRFFTLGTLALMILLYQLQFEASAKDSEPESQQKSVISETDRNPLTSLNWVCFRFVFLLLGPFGKRLQYHEIGRSMATLMTDEVTVSR